MIDGNDFANFVSGFVSVLKNGIIYIIYSLKIYYKIAVFLFVLIIGLGLLYSHHSKVCYEAVMVCSFKKMNKKLYGELLHDLDILAQNQSYNALAKHLNVSQQVAQQIISIEGKNMVGSRLYEDINTDIQPIYIDLKAQDKSIYPLLQSAIVYYLNTADPYLIATTKMDSADIEARINNLEAAISIADSIINTNYAFFKKSKPFSDTSLSAAKFVDMIRYKRQLDMELVVQKRQAKELEQNVEILHGFMPADRPVNNKKRIWRIALIVGVITSCGVVVLRRAFYDGVKQI